VLSCMRGYILRITLLIASWLKYHRHRHRWQRRLKRILLRNMPIQRLLDCLGINAWKGFSNGSLFITTMSFSVIEMGWGMGSAIGQANGILYKLSTTILIVVAHFSSQDQFSYFLLPLPNGLREISSLSSSRISLL
jgi:hypothetical protein